MGLHLSVGFYFDFAFTLGLTAEMIVFLPFDKEARGTASIKTLHKRDNLFVYEIEYSESVKIQSAHVELKCTTDVNKNEMMSIEAEEPREEKDSTEVKLTETTIEATIETPIEEHLSGLIQLYNISGLMPLNRIGTGIFNIFVVIWSVDEELRSFTKANSLFKLKYFNSAASNSKFVSVEVFDFDVASRWTLRLWRDRASWIKNLVPGDCVLVWGVNSRNRGRVLNTTARSQLFLLGSAHEGRKLHARRSHLSAEELEICQFLEEQAKACPQTSLPTHATMDLNGFECSAVIKERDDWILSGPSESSFKIIFQSFDARTWILISELIEGAFSHQIALKNITKDGHFTSKSSMLLLDSRTRQLPFHDTAKALDSKVIFNGLIALKGRLQKFTLPANESVNTSITSSQPERWRFMVSGGVGSLILESACGEESTEEREYILLVKTLLETDNSIIRKTYSIIR